MNLNNINEVLGQLSLSVNANFSQQQSMMSEKFKQLQNIVLPAIQTHPEVFSKYKGIHAGQDVVIMGSGPTVNFYDPVPNAIHIGVNSSFLQDKVKLDYLFIQDRFPTIQNKYDELLKYDCKKFFGIHYIQPEGDPFQTITEKDVQENNAERYYFMTELISDRALCLMSNDITTRPLIAYASTIFCALDFILWTHPKKLYIVGCDLTAYKHFDDFTDKCKRNIDCESGMKLIYEGWNIFKEYIERHYPDTEVISINPIGLKGLFNDIYTNSYLLNNPKIKNELKDDVKIINEGSYEK